MTKTRKRMEAPLVFRFEAAVLGFSSGPERGHLAVALADGTVRLISRSVEPILTAAAHRGPVLGIGYHLLSDAFLTAGEDGRVCRVTVGGDASEIVRLGSKWVENLIVDPGTGRCAVTSGRELHVFSPDLQTQRTWPLPSTPGALGLDVTRARVVVPHYGGVTLLPLDADEDDGGAAVWKGSHLAASVSPNGRWLVSAMQENALHVWPMPHGEDLGMRGFPAKPKSLSWTADSSLLLCSGADSVMAWQFKGRGPAERPPLTLGWADGGLATQVAAHPTAPVAAVGFDNGCVLFADLRERKAVTLEEPSTAGVSALSWSGDGTVLMIGHLDGRVIVHDITQA